MNNYHDYEDDWDDDIDETDVQVKYVDCTRILDGGIVSTMEITLPCIMSVLAAMTYCEHLLGDSWMFEPI